MKIECIFFLIENLFYIFVLWKQIKNNKNRGREIFFKCFDILKIQFLKNFSNEYFILDKFFGIIFTGQRIILLAEYDEQIFLIKNSFFKKNFSLKIIKKNKKTLIKLLFKILQIKKHLILIDGFYVKKICSIFRWRINFFKKKKLNCTFFNHADTFLHQRYIILLIKPYYILYTLVKKLFVKNLTKKSENTFNNNLRKLNCILSNKLFKNQNIKSKLKLIINGKIEQKPYLFDKNQKYFLFLLLSSIDDRLKKIITCKRNFLLNPSNFQIFFFQFLLGFVKLSSVNNFITNFTETFRKNDISNKTFIFERFFIGNLNSKKSGPSLKNKFSGKLYFFKIYFNQFSSKANGLFKISLKEPFFLSPKGKLIFLDIFFLKKVQKEIFFLTKDNNSLPVSLIDKRTYFFIFKKIILFYTILPPKHNFVNNNNFIKVFNYKDIISNINIGIIDFPNIKFSNYKKKPLELFSIPLSFLFSKLKKVKIVKIKKTIYVTIDNFGKNSFYKKKYKKMQKKNLENFIIKLHKLDFSYLKIMCNLFRIKYRIKKKISLERIMALKFYKNFKNIPQLANLTSNPTFHRKEKPGMVQIHQNGMLFLNQENNKNRKILFTKIRNIFFYHKKKDFVFLLDFEIYENFNKNEKKTNHFQIFYESSNKSCKTERKSKISIFDPEYEEDFISKITEKKTLKNFNDFIYFLLKISGINIFIQSQKFSLPVLKQKQNVLLLLFKNFFGSFGKYPPFFIQKKKLKYVVFERFVPNAKSFDLVFIFKKKKNKTINWERMHSITSIYFHQIEKLLKFYKVIFHIISVNINWKKFFIKKNFFNFTFMFLSSNDTKEAEFSPCKIEFKNSDYSSESFNPENFLLKDFTQNNTKKNRLNWEDLMRDI